MKDSILKACRKCNEVKSLDDFHNDARAKDGKRSECKSCKAKYAKSRYDENAGLEREKARQRYAKNADKRKVMVKKYKAENQEFYRQYNREYRAKNRDRLLVAEGKWREENAERHRENSRQWVKRNPDRAREINRRWREKNAEQVAERLARRRALQRSAEADVGITVHRLRELHGDQCVYCLSELIFESSAEYNPLRATIDHILPLAKGGSHTWDNTALSCFRCNASKGDQLLSEWRGYAGNWENGTPLVHTATP